MSLNEFWVQQLSRLIGGADEESSGFEYVILVVSTTGESRIVKIEKNHELLMMKQLLSSCFEFRLISYGRRLPLSSNSFMLMRVAGQGEFPHNARQFWTGLLNTSLSSHSLSKWRSVGRLSKILSVLSRNMFVFVRFAIFGLGDSRYPQFNVAARKLRTRLKHLGAQEFFRYEEFVCC